MITDRIFLDDPQPWDCYTNDFRVTITIREKGEKEGEIFLCGSSQTTSFLIAIVLSSDAQPCPNGGAEAFDSATQTP